MQSDDTPPKSDLVPWRRYWRPLDAPVASSVFEDRFLPDPESLWERSAATALKTLPELAESLQILVLCGEPGIGKSIELKLHRGKIACCVTADDVVLWVMLSGIQDFNDFRRRTVDTTEWRRWIQGTGKLTLVIDGIDEGLFRIRDFVAALANLISDAPVDRLRLRLTCRSAEWPHAQGETLLQLFGGTSSKNVFALCRLLRSDAEMMAEHHGLDGRRFLKAVGERQVESFAARPVTLKFLVNQFAAHQTLPNSHRELYEMGCERLCAEHDPVRAEMRRADRTSVQPMSPEKRLSAAQRLAALLLIGGKAVIHAPVTPSDETTSAELDVSDASKGSALGEDAFLDVLFTGLFVPAGPHRFAFAHQTYAEFLASRELCKLSLKQLRALLFARDGSDEHVIPQLAELTAWVAEENLDLRNFLLEREPEILLRSDATRWRPEIKAALISALFDKASQEGFSDDGDRSAFYIACRHPGMTAQLSSVLRDHGTNKNAKLLAITIAGAVKDSAMTDDLLALVRDEEQDLQVRRAAILSLEECVPKERLNELEPLARGECGRDPGFYIQGCALRRLVSEHWPVRRALPYLPVSSGDGRGTGPLHATVYNDFPRHVTRDDIESILDATEAMRSRRGRVHPLAPLADAAFDLGLTCLDDPKIVRRLVKAWCNWQSQRDGPTGDSDAISRKRLAAEPKLRRQMSKAFILDLETPVEAIDRACLDAILVNGRDDLGWLLDELPSIPVSRQPCWCKVISRLAWPQHLAPHWDQFLKRLETFSALAADFEMLRAWNMDEPVARNARAGYLREQRLRRWEQRHLVNLRLLPSSLIEESWKQIGRGRIWFFTDLCFGLAAEPGGEIGGVLPMDITATLGWRGLDEAQRQKLAQAARQFLIECDDGRLAHGLVGSAMLAGRLAVWQLRDRLATDAELRDAVLTKWIPALLRCPESDDRDANAAFELIYGLAPERAIEELIREAREECRRNRRPLVLRRAAAISDTKLAAALGKLTHSLFAADSVKNTLDEIASLNHTLMVNLAREIIERGRNATTSECRNQLRGALRAGLAHAADVIWPLAKPLFDNDDLLAERVFLQVCYGAEAQTGGMLSRMKSSDLADLYTKLNRIFPSFKDPIRSGPFPSQREAVVHVRQALPQHIASRGDSEACAALLRIAEQRPKEAEWFRALYRQALSAKRRKQWTPLCVENVRSLLDHADARLIRDEDDLLEVVLESLDRLQTKLTRSALPAVERFWNHTGMGLRRKNFRPKDEDFLSDEIARWLAEDLGPARGVVVNREVQPVRQKRTDILVEAILVTNSTFEATLSVTIEVKGCWHAEVCTALETQLVADYLQPHGRTHGIYLIGWFICDRWKGKWSGKKNRLPVSDFLEAQNYAMDLAKSFDGKQRPFKIASVVLDLRLPI